MSEITFNDNFFSHFTEIMDEAIQPTQVGHGKTLSNSPYYIGMMSGTSLDGMDAVLCQFYDETGEIEMLESHSLAFPDDLRTVLLALTVPNGAYQLIEQNQLAFESELDLYGWASSFYAEFASQVVIELLQKSGMTADDIGAIGCHGQTVRHRPNWGFTLQLIDPNIIAERTGIAVVSDFRRRDMAVGGQGAPLVPAFHQAIFKQNQQKNQPNISAVLNLGGIANVTIFNEEQTFGFDTGVANLLIDGWVHRNTGQLFDKNGDWAKSGQVIEPLLKQLLTHPFFAENPPKSTGREAFNLAWLDEQLHLFYQVYQSDTPNELAPQDVQATLTELTAVSVANALQAFEFDDKHLLVCGGGALNTYLMSRLQSHLGDWTMESSEKYGILPTLVESMAFAWLARQTMTGEPSNLPSVTGANKAVVLGQVCF